LAKNTFLKGLQKSHTAHEDLRGEILRKRTLSHSEPLGS
jgi:hypothetical protein